MFQGGVSMQNMGFSNPGQGQNSPAPAGTNGTSGNTGMGDSMQQNSGGGQQGHQTQAPQQKELNAASLCRFGQETVQELVSRGQEIFQCLRILQVGWVVFLYYEPVSLLRGHWSP